VRGVVAWLRGMVHHPWRAAWMVHVHGSASKQRFSHAQQHVQQQCSMLNPRLFSCT
jgi:hypothetical protein